MPAPAETKDEGIVTAADGGEEQGEEDGKEGETVACVCVCVA